MMPMSENRPPTAVERRIRFPKASRAASAPLRMGDAVDGEDTIRVTERFLTRNGRPWLPVMGEYHFSRDRRERWNRELRKIRAGGVDLVATYVFWSAHEEHEGVYRWDHDRDLRAFVETAAAAGLKVVLRIGPWAHGEARNGGFPDWLQALPIGLRTDDEAYLAHVRRWFAAIAQQVRGLFRTPDDRTGPILGIQIENELYDQPQHLATLRAIAESVGMRASLWTATGWGGAQLPTGELLPVYAGYSDGFWEESDTGWPAFGAQHFTFTTVRDDLTVGADLRDAEVVAGDDSGEDDPWPYATCELGGGMTTAYHRRPLVDSDDVAALALTKLGSGTGWQGFYMFHGGRHRGDLATSAQESHATGYPNDMPTRDYDFYAPIGADGQERPHFHKLRRQHLFLRAFGERLAAYPAVLPEADADPLRWSVRGDRDRGFLFVNSHQPAGAQLGDVADVMFRIDCDGLAVTVPTRPVTVRGGSYFFWPIRQRFGDIDALTATAQPITEFETEAGHVVLFAATPGVPVEVQLEDLDGAVRIRGGYVALRDGCHVVTPTSAPGVGCEVQVGDTTLVFLDPETADAVWRGPIDGRETVVIWRGEGWFDDGFRAVMCGPDTSLDIYPLPEGVDGELDGAGTVFHRVPLDGIGGVHRLEAPLFDARPLAPGRRGGSAGRRSAPTSEDFEHAGRAELLVPAQALAGADTALLVLDWLGDVMRIQLGEEVIADQFWHGRGLEVDLSPYRERLATEPLVLLGFAWEPDSEVYVDPRVRPADASPVLEIRAARVENRAVAQVGRDRRTVM